MSEIARFYGIIIRMYPERGERHHLPHFHAYYQDDSVSYSIDSVEAISGELPRRQRRLIEAWVELHREEIAENWRRMYKGEPPRKIDPLR